MGNFFVSFFNICSLDSYLRSSAMPVKGHLLALKAKVKELNSLGTQTRLSMGGLERLTAFKKKVVKCCSEARISPAQAEYLFPLFQEYCPIYGNSLPMTGRPLFEKYLSVVENDLDEEMREHREGFQLHLSNDAGQDRRGLPILFTTAEFNSGTSQLIDMTFPKTALNNLTLKQLLENNVLSKCGGWMRIDSLALDSVAYNLTYIRLNLTPELCPTIPLPDVCHRFDGVLDKIFENSIVGEFIRLLNSQFSATNRKWVQGWALYLDEKGQIVKKFPSMGETRAWTGSYRICEYLFPYLRLLINYILRSFRVTKSPSESFKKLHTFCGNDEKVASLKVELVWLLQYTADIVVAIMNLQARRYSTVQSIFNNIESFLEWMDIRTEDFSDRETFREYVLMDDKKLIEAYNKLKDTGNSKRQTKARMIACIVAGRDQLVKNFGSFQLEVVDVPKYSRIDDDSLSLSDSEEDLDSNNEETVKRWQIVYNKDKNGNEREGDSSGRRQISFYAIASLLDPRKKGSKQCPPTRQTLRDGISWCDVNEEVFSQKKSFEYLDPIYDQLVKYMTEEFIVPGATEDGFDCRQFWKALKFEDKFAEKYDKLCDFALRVLAVAGGSAEVERAVSSEGLVTTDRRLRLKDENVRAYTKILANCAKRQRKNDVRTEKRLKRRKTDRERKAGKYVVIQFDKAYKGRPKKE